MKKMIEKEKKYLLNELLGIFGDDLTSVILFGSRARKNYTDNSDVDLILIIKKAFDGDLIELRKSYGLKYGKSLDILIFLQEDAINNFEDFSPVFATLILGKAILFDRGAFFEEKFRDFVRKIANQNIKYCEGGKIWDLRKEARSLEILQ